MKKKVAVSLIGTQLDYVGKRVNRWTRWRPNVSLCSQKHLIIDELHILHDNHSQRLANNVAADIETIAPNTSICLHIVNFSNPWDFEEVYAKLIQHYCC